MNTGLYISLKKRIKRIIGANDDAMTDNAALRISSTHNVMLIKRGDKTYFKIIH